MPLRSAPFKLLDIKRMSINEIDNDKHESEKVARKETELPQPRRVNKIPKKQNPHSEVTGIS